MAFMTSKYKLTVTEKQAEIMRDALELYARIHAGQISTLSEHLPHILSGKADLTEELKKAYKPFLLTKMHMVIILQTIQKFLGIYTHLSDIA